MQDTLKSTSPSLMDHEFTFRDLADSCESPMPSSPAMKTRKDPRKHSFVPIRRLKTLKSVELAQSSGAATEAKLIPRPQEFSIKKAYAKPENRKVATIIRHSSKVLVRSSIQTSKFSMEGSQPLDRTRSFNIFEDNYDEWVSRRNSAVIKTVPVVSEFKITSKTASTKTENQGSSKTIDTAPIVESRSPANRSASRSKNFRLQIDSVAEAKIPVFRQTSLPRAIQLMDGLANLTMNPKGSFLQVSPPKSDKNSKPGVDIRMLHVKRHCGFRPDELQR